VLVGLPGSGKTTTGRELAARLGVAFEDSDDVIVRTAGRSVPEIFAADGEAGFRGVEAVAVADALAAFDGVLALGGGAVLTESTRRALASAGVPVVLLRTEVPELLQRLGSGRGRPLLADDVEARLRELIVERSELYRQVATVTVDTDGHTVTEVAEAIEARLPASPSAAVEGRSASANGPVGR
jgi:shikimate kinase